jgi:hypothetical protein
MVGASTMHPAGAGDRNKCSPLSSSSAARRAASATRTPRDPAALRRHASGCPYRLSPGPGLRDSS